jgi:outer membrane biosynthesis protein TonB
MIRKLLAVLALLASASTGAFIAASSVHAEPLGKVIVCKYVGTPGVDETPQTGQNPIAVSANALDGKGFAGIFPFTFQDAQGQSIAIRYATSPTDNGNASECPGFEPSPTPTETPGPTPTETPSPTPTETPSPTPTETETPSPTETETPSPSPTETPTEAPTPPVIHHYPKPPKPPTPTKHDQKVLGATKELAFTGSKTTPLVVLALILLLAGVALLRFGKRTA